MTAPALPSVRALPWRHGDRVWTVRYSEDLGACVAAGDHLCAAVADQLACELALAGDAAMRAVIDAQGALLAAAVDPIQAVVALGSPRMAHERFLVETGRWVADPQSADHLTDLQALVAGWDAADPAAGALDVEKLARDCDLLPWWRAEGATGRALAAAEAETAHLARRVAAEMDDHRPGLRERISQWGLGLTTEIAVLRVHLLRFVAALPALDHDTAGTEVVRLLRETLRRMGTDDARLRAQDRGSEAMPAWMAWGVQVAATVVAWLPTRWVAAWTRAGVRAMARTFIAGEDMPRATKALRVLAGTGRDATVDQLGELVVSEAEADVYRDRVLGLVEGIARQAGPGRNAAGLPRAHVSIKTSALCSDYNPDDPDGVWRRVGPRLLAILRAARAAGVFIHMDAEHYPVRDLTFVMLRRALDEAPDLRDWPDIGIVVQAYLRDAGHHLNDVIAFARGRGVVMPLRLVKGAYWDAETIESEAHDVVAPQFLNKCETDAAYQLLTIACLRAGDAVQLCLGSHNLRDHCFAEAARARLFPAAPSIEHQALHMTYEALSRGMAAAGWAVRNYVPVGSLLVGMAYLVRRILENSSQVGVLTAARHGVDLEALLQVPRDQVRRSRDTGQWQRAGLLGVEPAETFRNVAPLLLDRPAHRAALQTALDTLQTVDADDPARSGELSAVVSPSDPGHVVGHIRLASTHDVGAAIDDAVAELPAWRTLPAPARAVALVRAAEHLRAARPWWSALVVAESGKARAEAVGDVDEAIDFLHYYARQAVAHADAHPSFQGLGVFAVVAPWNFPLAIPCGMTAAALAAGNAALLKSAEQTPLVADAFVRLLHRCGVPEAIVRHLPGDGPEIGAPLTRDPRLAGVVFTGSQHVGCLLHRTVGPRTPGDRAARVIAEMGGKNAIVVTANADLDQAVSGTLRSAFGHAGQKCSACSRVLVDARVAGAFAERFCRAARDLQLGPAAAPGTRINPVVSAEDRARLRQAAMEVARETAALGGKVLVDRSLDSAGPLPQTCADGAQLVGPVVAELPESAGLDADTFACKELFGPVVHLVAVPDLDAALRVWRAPLYALTGGVFAQSEDDIEALAAAARVGNLYVNRPITGARVAIEPFGGFWMSGTGPKAGGPDYLPALTGRTVHAPALDAEAREVVAAMPPSPPSGTGVSESAAVEPEDASALGRRAADLAGLVRGATWVRSEPTRTALLAICRSAATAAAADNRKIPGQTSANRWHHRKGAVAVLAGQGQPTLHALAHVVAASVAGNPVRVLAVSPAAVRAWTPIVAALGAVLRDIADAPALCDALLRVEFASVVLDGSAQHWQPALAVALAQRATDRHLRQVLAEGSWPPPEACEAVLRCQLHCATVVVNTMRHGAELEV
ncbi:MAG: proline dehydrogenase family protein [Deltaproteobacteria bacterium]|nr:proline dehydrogenase family protein [Deltaproteobacteria bacterium]